VTPERIAEVRARCEAATPADSWDVEPTYTPLGAPSLAAGYWAARGPCHPFPGPSNEHTPSMKAAADANFARAARTDLPEALDEIERSHDSIRRLSLACHNHMADLVELGSLAGCRDDEYPRKAVERAFAEHAEAMRNGGVSLAWAEEQKRITASLEAQLQQAHEVCRVQAASMERDRIWRDAARVEVGDEIRDQISRRFLSMADGLDLAQLSEGTRPVSIAGMRAVLEELDARGGLGLEMHDRIAVALGKPTHRERFP
jgi:hypothetical protein